MNLPAFFGGKSMNVCSHTCLSFLPILNCTNCSPGSGTEAEEFLGGGDGWVEQKLHFPLKGRGRSAERTERPFIPIKKSRGKSSSQWRWKIFYLNPGKILLVRSSSYTGEWSIHSTIWIACVFSNAHNWQKGYIFTFVFIFRSYLLISVCMPDKDISWYPIQMRNLKFFNHLRHLDFELHLFGYYLNN